MGLMKDPFPRMRQVYALADTRQGRGWGGRLCVIGSGPKGAVTTTAEAHAPLLPHIFGRIGSTRS
jgi:hypothetical protein